MASAGNLTADLELKTAQFVSELKRTNNRLSRFEKRFESMSRRGSSAFRTLGRSAKASLAVLAGGGITAALTSTARLAENLDLVGTRLGVSARELQAWQLIAERAGVNINQFNTGLQRLARRAQEAAIGTGEARGALRELGIDATRFSQLSLDQRMITLARAFEQNTDQISRLRLAFKLFDAEGTTFLQFLNQGEQGLRELRRELDGQVWSDSQRRKLSEANQKITELSQSARLFSGQLAGAALSAGELVEKLSGESGLTGALSKLATPFKDFFKFARVASGGASTGGEITIDRGLPPARPRPVPQIAPTVTSREIAPPSSVLDASEVMTTAIDAQTKAFAEMLDKAEQAKRTFVTLFTDNLVVAAESGFKSMAESFARTLQQMAARALASRLFDLFGFGNPGGGFLGFGKLISGERAHGGPVAGGRAYLVGERGPEVFVPGSSGKVLANGTGGGGVQIIDQRGAQAPPIEVSGDPMAGFRVLVRSEFQRMLADGTGQRMFAASGMPIRRRGQR